ncbi:MAG: DegV family protein, partial [Chloroflexi bacterium]|nr:DegV family protein [Chloroflexota bacterium]
MTGIPTTAIVTDSTACIPSEMQKNLQITEVPYYIHKGSQVLRDLLTVQRDDFLRWLPTAVELPTTACPGQGDYLTTYESLASQGAKNIISIHMTSKGSGAYQSALAAASLLHEKLPKIRIEVIDTLNVALCQGWIAIEAARDSLSGVSLEGVLDRIRSLIPLAKMIQTADTLRYLYMGGRIGKATHLVGSMLSLKPLISMENGEIIALGVARGLHKAYEKMVSSIEKTLAPSLRIKIAYMHAGASENVQILKKMVENRIEVVESFVSELSPALMVHTGPGTTGF